MGGCYTEQKSEERDVETRKETPPPVYPSNTIPVPSIEVSLHRSRVTSAQTRNSVSRKIVVWVEELKEKT